MSSEEQAASLTHAETSDRPSRQRHTPKHLEDYLLDYSHHRPAPSSQLALGMPEEKEGDAAAVSITSQTRASSSQGEPPATGSTDLMNMSSLRDLLKSMSTKEREETADMAVLQSQLKQCEQRQRWHKKLMEHITSS